MADTTRLTLLPFPQRWHGPSKALTLRVLVLPRTHPLRPLEAGQPPFADARIALQAAITPSLSALPSRATAVFHPLDLVAPSDKREVFDTIARSAPLADDPEAELPPAMQIRKHLPTSYRTAFAFAGPRRSFLTTEDDFACAIDKVKPVSRPNTMPPLTWGRVLGSALQRPPIAARLGLWFETTFALEPSALAAGAWLFVILDTASDYAGVTTPDFVRSYAARILPVGAEEDRRLFAPTLFPVDVSAIAGEYDTVVAENDEYAAGFAKIVHARQPRSVGPREDDPTQQPPFRDVGIELGWDDEQVAIWLDRQTKLLPGATRPWAMMGVSRYVVDVLPEDADTWQSLQAVRGPLSLGPIDFGRFEGELGVEPHPQQLEARSAGDYWLPQYFARWDGSTIGLPDPVAQRLGRHGAARVDTPFSPASALPELRYGQSYRFRVRLRDLSGGGPAASDPTRDPGPAPEARIDFRRHVPPGALRLVSRESETPGEPPSIRLFRPLISYPEAVFTGAPDAVQRLIDSKARADREGGEVGIPDPDVDLVEIVIKVRGLQFDSVEDGDCTRTLATTTRPFPKDPEAPLDLEMRFVDVADIATLDGVAQPTFGPILLPSARDVRLEMRAFSSRGLDYFGSEEARRGSTMPSNTRKESASEDDLFAADSAQESQLCALFLRPEDFLSPTAEAALASGALLERVAAELRLAAKDLTLAGTPGRRVVFASARGLRTTLAPDAGSITFMSKDELVHRWIVVVRVVLARDWTWDGLADQALVVRREGAQVGAVQLPRSIGGVGRLQARRSQTEIVFFDVLDPQPRPGEFPAERTLSYEITPQHRGAATLASLALRVTLPMAVPPAQTPRVVSAGFALTPFVRDERYTRTEPRERMLWLEFAEAPANPRDAYFARVLAHAPDPMLRGLAATAALSPTDPPDPELPLDPEPLRVIRPSAVDDQAGLGAMQRLIPTDSPRHFLVPLPPGLSPTSPELFGMFTYEIRVGHREGWSTAHGRFGAALRLTGVQHPVPQLDCSAAATDDAVNATSGFAEANAGAATDLWIVLYAQVAQLDGASWRNVLLSRRRVLPGASPRASWTHTEIREALRGLGLAPSAPLSVLAVELLPELGRYPDPLGGDLGQVRILRTSTLVPVPAFC
jgi:hypothetical protein